MFNYPHPREGILLYWKFEKSGVLRAAILRFIRKEHLTECDIDLIRQYLSHWADFEWWRVTEDGLMELQNLRASARNIKTREQIEKWIAAASSLNIDPL